MSTEMLKKYQMEVALAMKTAAEEYITEHPPEKVAAQTVKHLEESREDILRTLLGFEINRWGKGEFKVDHCNGRSGESAVGDYLREVQSDAIRKWLKTAELGELNDAMKVSMRTEFNEIYSSRLKKLVDSHANNLAQKHFDELREQDVLGDLAKMDSLLSN